MTTSFNPATFGREIFSEHLMIVPYRLVSAYGICVRICCFTQDGRRYLIPSTVSGGGEANYAVLSRYRQTFTYL